MKRVFIRIGFPLFALMMLANIGWSQSDKFMWHGGFCYQFVTFRQEFQPITARGLAYMYGITGGMNYILAHSNDQVSVGINPNANLGFSLSNSGVGFLGQLPVYLLARVGANSTPYNETKVGVGAGVGCNFSYWYVSNSGFSQLNTAFYNPSLLAELNIKGRASDYAIRFNWSVYRPKVEIDSQRYEMGTSTLSIIYSF